MISSALTDSTKKNPSIFLYQWQPFVTAILLFFLYRYLLIFSLAYAPVILTMPDWWYGVFGLNSLSAISYMQIIHFIGLLAASIPIAGILMLFKRKSALWMAVLLGIFLTLEMLWEYFSSSLPVASTLSQLLSMTLDIVKLLLTLPLITWFIFRRGELRKV